MKRFIVSCLLTVFGFSLVMFSAITTSQAQIAPPEVSTLTSVASDSAMATASSELVEEPVFSSFGNYYFPYPGILPDHQLYPLKMIRDRVVLFLTRDPIEHRNRLVLYADKRIGASQVLIRGGKAELGLSTASKANGYLVRAVATLTDSDEPHQWQALAQTITAHRLLLEEIKAESSGDLTVGLERLLVENQRLLDQASAQLQ